MHKNKGTARPPRPIMTLGFGDASTVDLWKRCTFEDEDGDGACDAQRAQAVLRRRALRRRGFVTGPLRLLRGEERAAEGLRVEEELQERVLVAHVCQPGGHVLEADAARDVLRAANGDAERAEATLRERLAGVRGRRRRALRGGAGSDSDSAASGEWDVEGQQPRAVATGELCGAAPARPLVPLGCNE